MQKINDSPELLEHLMCPAFMVKDGIILHTNQSALDRQIQLNTPVGDLISIGKEEYAQFTHGRLCLTLCICDVSCQASITQADGFHLFCLESSYENPEFRAYALAAQHLREALSSAMSSAEILLPSPALQEDPEMHQQAAQLNRSLHQLLRTVCNMSDAALYHSFQSCNMQTRDAAAFFEEILEKTSALAEQAKRTLLCKCPSQSIHCLIDEEKLERALLNLISNAIKYTPEGGTIEASLRSSGSRLYFTIQGSGDGLPSKESHDVFSRFLREPGIEDGRNGIGLGMSIVRSVAAIHGGTVLMEQPADAGLRFTMTIVNRPPDSTQLHSISQLLIDYAGGWDHALLELSDALPDSVYQ